LIRGRYRQESRSTGGLGSFASGRGGQIGFFGPRLRSSGPAAAKTDRRFAEEDILLVSRFCNLFETDYASSGNRSFKYD
jgi:hypothetical protein